MDWDWDVCNASCGIYMHVRTFGTMAAPAATGTTDKQRDAGGDDDELADLLPRRVPRLLQLLPLLSSHGGVDNLADRSANLARRRR